MKAVNADGWEEIQSTLDLGAAETVMGEDMLGSVEMEGAASKRGVGYEIATKNFFPNLGRSFRPVKMA